MLRELTFRLVVIRHGDFETYLFEDYQVIQTDRESREFTLPLTIDG